ncbi:L-threonate dehydrogenase [Loktanella sp. SALINAS62]|uniref:L-threonate dehydrogenase n=1 Tax=Loktanella sp. SALINAS62 TaxID=2706124 RepID=UPI001B8BB855|nr:L-threonate dehydrogenase [Loktanella sp. SALINAS62]MBS1302631.1 NAD(P)-dependent oxidoreductase [Loktanella sp. SALINAS62]
MAVITVIGLGSMGLGMALSLCRAGHRVIGCDLRADAAKSLVAEGGETGTPREAAAQSDVVVSVVLNADQTEAVLFGAEGCAGTMKHGSAILSCATVPPQVARRLAAKAEALGLHYLDAPISGGAAKAAQGKLSIMAAGTEAAFDAARPALDAMAETVHDLGRVAGAGSAMKAVNQLLAGVHIAAMGEALAFASSQGLDLQRTVDVISASAGTSWMFENRAPHVVAADFAPRSAVTIWPKDLGIVSTIADDAGLPVPLTRAALGQFEAAVAAGWGAEDDAAVTRVYARAAGLTLPGDS